MVFVYHDSLGQVYATPGVFGHLGHLAGNGTIVEREYGTDAVMTTHRMLFTCEEMAAKHILDILKKPQDKHARFGVQPIYYVCANSREGAWIIKRWEGLMPQETMAACDNRAGAEALARQVEQDYLDGAADDSDLSRLGALMEGKEQPIEFIDECAGQQSKSWEPELEALVRK